LGDSTEITITFFQTRITDEIFFGEGLTHGVALNRNYDEETVRSGLEADLKWYPLDSLYLWANSAYADARFSIRNTFIPLVPKHTFSLGLEWRVSEPFSVSLAGVWVGSRYDGNDETNDRFEKLPPYKALDTKITYQHKKWRLFAGIKNLFDELYSTSAYSERYYPMPGREFYGGVEWRY
ncbi:MAG: TonB-dependent receptor, partial [Deltaproteobacteria bacterium]|nr:TonB-dependent receptor [Deltaproteobacteria bacterium]